VPLIEIDAGLGPMPKLLFRLVIPVAETELALELNDELGTSEGKWAVVRHIL
jgi:hypothetical protein